MPRFSRAIRVIDQGWILVNEDGKIKQIGEGEIETIDNAGIIDAAGSLLLPGMIDIHIHGGEWSQCSRWHI